MKLFLKRTLNIRFVPTGAGKQNKPREPVELPIENFELFPPLLRKEAE